MLSRKRPILFEVMGRRGRPSRQAIRETPVPRIREKAAPRIRVRESTRLLVASPAVRWAALALVVVVAVTFAFWRLHRPSAPQPPQLQTNVDDRPGPDAAEGAGRASRSSFAVCAMERPYKTPAERKLAAEKVQEIVD